MAMSEVHYRVVEHDGGWAYVSQGVYSETFRTHDAAAQAARRVAAEQTLAGSDEIIEYEDENGHWHIERAAGGDRPKTDVED
jgi:hypothetical protein